MDAVGSVARGGVAGTVKEDRVHLVDSIQVAVEAEVARVW